MSISIVDLRRSFFGGADTSEQETLQEFYDQGVSAADLLDLVVNPAGGGDFTAIAQTILGADGSITFSAIPNTYEHLRIMLMGRGGVAGTADDLRMRFNGDTGNNYNNNYLTGSGSTASSGSWGGAGYSIAGRLPGATAPAGYAGLCIIEIPFYKRTTFHKPWVARSQYSQGTADANQTQQVNSGMWRNTAAIASIELVTLNANLLAGSAATLYGCNAPAA